MFPPKSVTRDGMERLIPYLAAFKNAVEECQSSGTLDLSGVVDASAQCSAGADAFDTGDSNEEFTPRKGVVPCPALTDVLDRVGTERQRDDSRIAHMRPHLLLHPREVQ